MTHENDLSPLAVLLQAMWAKWDTGDQDAAVKIARSAAPYVHAKRRDVAISALVDVDLHRLSDAEINDRLAEARKRVVCQGDPAVQPSRVVD